MTVYVEKERADHIRLVNDTGAALVEGEFAVVNGIAAIADEAVASLATGSFHVAEGIVVQASDLTTSEDTFATGGQEVYWDPSGKKFSDTKKSTYYEVGRLVEVKTGGVIRFAKFFRATPKFVQLTDVDMTSVDDNDTMKYVLSTGFFTRVAV